MSGSTRALRTRTLVLAGVLVALVLAGVLSFYASGNPDGLERVAHDKGFSRAAGHHHTGTSPMAGYSTKGIHNGRISTGVAGVTGTLLVLAVAGGGFWVLRRRSSRTESS